MAPPCFTTLCQRHKNAIIFFPTPPLHIHEIYLQLNLSLIMSYRLNLFNHLFNISGHMFYLVTKTLLFIKTFKDGSSVCNKSEVK